MPTKRAKKSGGLAIKLLTVEPEYRFASYKKILAKRGSKKKSTGGSPVLPGSFENGKRR